jgi:serine/threonine-protein kinase
MSATRWQRLQDLFEALLAVPPAARAEWLGGIDADADLKREALALAQADLAADAGVTAHLLEAAGRVAAAPAQGMRLGPYRLVREIGSGGMGTVFLAERVDASFEQRVAIKLLRGMPTREATERMRRERQILADLSHPHIARLIDGGNTADGQPWLVMEYVEGVPLNEYCRDANLSLGARLRLVQKICSAVQYAHQRLVIHRDLKPANVLVRPDGEPVLLDFGIAKLLVDTGPGAQQTGMPWFTPAYASPEQRRGEAVGTGTDVYGLGLLLYEVVSGRMPPSDGTRLPPPSRGPLVAGIRPGPDLDLIVAKATHAEPERRYVSAAALADDLLRHLRGRPVHAAPDSLRYRAAKFVGRHRLAAFALCAGLAMAVLFTWRLAGERDRALRAEALAQQHSATAESVVDYLVALFRSASPEEAGTRPLLPRDLVDRGRRELDQRLAGAPQQRARLLAALGKIYIEIGVPESALESLGAAAELERTLGSPRRRAEYLSSQGFAYNLTEQPAAAVDVLGEAIALLEPVGAADRKLAADILSTRGIAQARIGEVAAGIDSICRALEFARAAEGEDSVLHAQSLYALAEARMRGGQLDAAEKSAVRSLEVMRRHLPEDAPDVIAATGFLTEVYEQQGRYAEGERLLRHMMDVRLRTLDPSSAWAITVRNNLAQAIQLQGRIVEATTLLRENVERMRASGQRDTPSYLIGLNNLASLLEQAGDYPGSLGLFEEVVAGSDRQPAFVQHQSTFRRNLGRSRMLNGRLDDARALLEAPVEEGATLDLAIERARRSANMAEWLRRSGRLPDALAAIDEARAGFARLYPQGHARLGGVALVRGAVLRDAGRLGEAADELRRAVEMLRRFAGAEANTTLDAELQLAGVLARLGRLDEARVLHARLAPLLPTRFVEAAPQRAQHAALARRLGARRVAMR